MTSSGRSYSTNSGSLVIKSDLISQEDFGHMESIFKMRLSDGRLFRIDFGGRSICIGDDRGGDHDDWDRLTLFPARMTHAHCELNAAIDADRKKG